MCEVGYESHIFFLSVCLMLTETVNWTWLKNFVKWKNKIKNNQKNRDKLEKKWKKGEAKP